MTAPQTIADTLYYGAGANIAALATDQSQYATNQTAAASWHYEATPASRFNRRFEWTIEVRITIDNTDTGRLYNYANAGLRLSAGGAVEPLLNGVVQAGVTIPTLGGTDEDVLISWSVRDNPDTTGASDALITEIRAWNLTDGGAPAVNRYTHAVRTNSNGDQVWWASSTAGANAFTGTPARCRFSSHYHTATESYEAMVSASSAPTLVGEARSEITVPTRSLGDDGYYAGPIHARAAAASAANDLRQAGPLGKVHRSRVTHRGDRVGDATEAYEDPTDAGSYLYTHGIRWIEVPPGANRLLVRAFVQQWRTTGDADTIRHTLLCMSQPGFVHRPPTSPATMQVYRQTISRTNNDTSGATSGAWITFDPIRIARDNVGCSYIALAHEITDAGGSGSIDDQLWTVKAIAIDPIFVDTDDQQPGLGG